jgi:hypothetical protein
MDIAIPQCGITETTGDSQYYTHAQVP